MKFKIFIPILLFILLATIVEAAFIISVAKPGEYSIQNTTSVTINWTATWLPSDSGVTFGNCTLFNASSSLQNYSLYNSTNYNVTNGTSYQITTTFADNSRNWFILSCNPYNTTIGQVNSTYQIFDVDTKYWDYIDIMLGLNITGNVIIGGDLNHNEHYAEIYLNQTENFVIAAGNVSYNLTSNNFTSDLSNGITISGGKMTITKASIYRAIHGEIVSGGGNKEYHYSIHVNGVDQEKCESHRKMSAGGDIGSSGMSCLLSLSVNDVVTYTIRNDEDSTDITLDHINFNLIEIS